MQHAYSDDFPEPVATPAKVEGQTHLTADKLDGEMNKVLKARGNVVVTRDDARLTSDWLDYYQDKNELKGGDRFTLTRPHERVDGTTITYDMDTHTGDGQKPVFSGGTPPMVLRGNGERVEFRGPDRYALYNSRATTCSVNDDSWYLVSSRLDLDYTTEVGVAHNAWIQFQGVPLLYTPWIDFPLDGNRKSGLLVPSFTSGTRGLGIALPYYWNIAPNYDATITPSYSQTHGTGLGLELRYLQPDYSGTIYTDQRLNDPTTNTHRYLWSVKHTQTLAPGLTMGVDATTVSDDNYFTDFADRITIADNTNLLRQAWVNYAYSWNGGSASTGLVAQRYQTLQNTSNSVTPPYALLPQLSFSANQSLPANFSANLTSSITRFSHPTLQEGDRTILYPSVSWNFDQMWGFVKPKIGVNYTYYDLSAYSGTAEHSITRTLPIFSTDSGLYFDRDTTLGGTNYTQTLEPRLYYLYVPVRDQSKIPAFDSSLNDFSFARLYSENDFSGGDRINGANDLTGGLTTRMLNVDTGREIARLMVGQRYYLNKQYINSSGTIVTHDSNSNYLVSLAGEPIEHWNFDSLLEYDPISRQSQQYNAQLRYQPATGKTVSLRLRFQREGQTDVDGNLQDLHQIDFGFQWPLTRNWYALFHKQYSLQDKQALDTLAGVEYNEGCWTLRLVADRYVTNYVNVTNSIFFQIELKGLGDLGTSPLETLRLAIPGYTKTNESQP